MISLFLASMLFVVIHAMISGTNLRGKLVAVMGEKTYAAGFSILSALALGWMILTFSTAPHVELWMPAAALTHLAMVLMLIAIMLAVLAFTTPNPTSVVGGGKSLREENAAKGIIKVTRHPFLVGVTLWAIAHILANGDLASVLFFGGFLILSIIGPPQIDAKRKAKNADSWARFSAQTSWLPFAAIFQGRARVTLGEIGWTGIAGGVALYVAILLFLHDWAFGVALF
ncbi:MAG: NnrU family protein [Alphaproteobacteria bacterium]|nr:NnrU family protein [Alphaproteobacteria bacterium]